MATPKKKASSKRGRKPKESSINDFCRVCDCSFKNYYGNFCQNRVSTENIFSLPGKTNVSKRPLALLLRDLSYVVEEGVGSSRVCAKCALKIRRAADLKCFLDAGLKKHERASSSVPCSPLDSPDRFKRMCNTPTGNCAKSVRKTSPLRSNKEGFGKSPRKRILFAETSQGGSDQGQISMCESMCVSDDDLTTLANPMPSTSCTDQSDKEKASYFSEVVQDNFQHFSAEYFKPECKPKIKVVIPQNGKLSERTPPDDTTAALIKNLCTKKWRPAANCLMKHNELKQEILSVLSKTVSKEVAAFCKSESVLKKSSADELSCFRNKNVVDEAKSICPFLFACVAGSCDAHKSEEKFDKAVNSLALVIAVIAKYRNHLMSAFAKRISTILLHSGAKAQDFARLNHLGICTSHKQAIRDQREMGKTHDIKLVGWKKEIENFKCLLLLQAIEKNQAPENHVELVLAKSTLEKYDGYSEEVFKELIRVLNEMGINLERDRVYLKDILELQGKLQGKKYPTYR